MKKTNLKKIEKRLKLLYLQRKALYHDCTFFKTSDRLLLLGFYQREIKKTERLLLLEPIGAVIFDKILKQLIKCKIKH